MSVVGAKPSDCYLCAGKLMIHIGHDVYEPCRKCLPLDIEFNMCRSREITNNVGCSACRDSGISFWAMDVSGPCQYCKKNKGCHVKFDVVYFF